MSEWTHVIGAIRYDGLGALGKDQPDLGTSCGYYDDDEQWEECDIPCGSEGSLQYAIWTNPDDNCVARWIATIFGDLRDYDEGKSQEVIDYFNRIVKDHFIRQGCFSFQINDTKRSFVYSHKNKCFEEQLKLEEL